MQPTIIGITGTFGSGKSTAADYLETKGFTKIVLSKFLEDALVYSGDSKVTRKKLQDLGNSWRELHGTGVLALKAEEAIKDKKLEKIVIEGIRNLGEIEELKKIGKFTLIALLSNREVRYKRLSKLKRREKLTPELFEKLDKRDMGVGEKDTGLHVAVCVTSADIYIENNGTQKDLEKKLEAVLKSI